MENLRESKTFFLTFSESKLGHLTPDRSTVPYSTLHTIWLILCMLQPFISIRIQRIQFYFFVFKVVIQEYEPLCHPKSTHSMSTCVNSVRVNLTRAHTATTSPPNPNPKYLCAFIFTVIHKARVECFQNTSW